MIPVAISLGTKEGLIVAALMVFLNIYEDKTESKPTQLYGSTTSVSIFSKGTYFCPFYCEARHVHRVHEKSYSCGLEGCSHFVVYQDKNNNIFKVKKSCGNDTKGVKLLTDTPHVSSTLIGRADK